ncbi:bifunctional chorismate mutase/prephenate dehydratase [Anaeromicropila herbilytica]|uniref:Bifunctional chorismate mutase/prephenate dehydratase n=1 Tax=Anaeromicropila herbilytica TaxID=2785025 RepID=A0A7R7EKD8_9FIRM|nr:bifunctional chorismate mutase/prephenate dehydratase [Anaeromicropila herbilytica]BCN30305.1 chorismate mutase [Anaeromicropila herbilytica]
MLDLKAIRDDIDVIDKQIVELFEKRMKLTNEVAEYKISTGKKVYDKEREEQKLATLKALASNEFNKHGIEELFTQIMSMSRKYQYRLVTAENQYNNFIQKEKIDMDENTKVVYFGVRGSYTEEAMENYFGENIQSFHEETFKGVMEALKMGRADYGVLPIENSSTGSIADIYDLLVQYDNYIIGEHIVKVDQALLGLPDAKLEDIRTVYSHVQGLLQSSKFLDTLNDVTRMEYASTASSAKKVLEDNDITQAAIASVRAGKCYGLKVLKEAINYNDANSTRFIIITNKKMFLKSALKTSICFELPHASGTLYNMLSHFIYNNLSMTNIESRPLEGRSWEYRFFVDFEGNLNDPGVKNALNGINAEAINMRILGSF